MHRNKDIKDDRSLASFILLSLLTLGIYDIWYVYHLQKDISELCREHTSRRVVSYPIYILLSLVTCGLYSVFWWFCIGDMLSIAAKKENVRTSVSGPYMITCMALSYIVCGISGLVAIHQVLETTNNLATKYNLKRRTKPAEERNDSLE